MKSEKGLSYIGMIILMVVIALLVFGIVYFVRIQYAKEKFEDNKTNLLLVQAKVKLISGEYLLEKKEEVLKGTKLEEKKEDPVIQQFLEKELIDLEDEDKKYYVWDEEILQELELTKIKLPEGGYYIVEYNTNEVYDTKGITYSDGNTYYQLTKIEELESEK